MPTTLPPVSKGRCKRLVQLRNERMIIRYYYWREIQRRRMDDVFLILSNDEFYLHETTIRRIISGNLHLFHQLKEQKPSERQLNNYEFN